MEPVVVGLAGAAELGADIVGAKAFNLARLAAAGVPTPTGFVVTASALDRWPVAAPAIQAAATGLATGWPAGPGAGRFAVRSSGVAEDLADASFAGQYDTLLDVALPDLPAAVREVFGSAGNQRIAAYHRARAGQPVPGSGMAVLVQPMVDADAAGVAFTAHP